MNITDTFALIYGTEIDLLDARGMTAAHIANMGGNLLVISACAGHAPTRFGTGVDLFLYAAPEDGDGLRYDKSTFARWNVELCTLDENGEDVKLAEGDALTLDDAITAAFTNLRSELHISDDTAIVATP